MPDIVKELTDKEKQIENVLKQKFSEEQMCVYFLTKTARSIYQFDDEFVLNWYQQIFERPPNDSANTRKELLRAYLEMLMFENKYQFHVNYWIRQLQEAIVDEMEVFFSGSPGQ